MDHGAVEGDSVPRHIPVLLDRVSELLGPALHADGAVYVDATLGLGGHAEYFLRNFPRVRLIGLDRDPRALELAAAGVLNTYSHAELARVLKDYGEERFAGRIASEIVRRRERQPFTTSAA